MPFIRSIILDDEPIARRILEEYIEKDERIILEGSYKSAKEATEALVHKKPDLIFLDINMPGISGLEFLRSITPTPIIIFTTGYRDYAIDGFNMNAVDYLLKPFSFERFLQAVGKAYLFSTKQSNRQEKKENDYIFVKADGKLVKIDLDSIYYIESIKEYVKIYTTSGIIVAYMAMHYLEEKLPKESFYRIHRSYIIGLKYIEAIEGNGVNINKTMLPVSRYIKDAFIDTVAGDRML
jgi:DNA-binding LytR/AlgR family response regulator